ncbi:hypothetical protein ACH5RR_008744 [Cinchona calisaya]|uniref:Uncharacterized protein n=1 Tax=Cinchona calisaya TaxID=153742 RepID=A0ABD3ACH5_9GENT
MTHFLDRATSIFCDDNSMPAPQAASSSGQEAAVERSCASTASSLGCKSVVMELGATTKVDATSNCSVSSVLVFGISKLCQNGNARKLIVKVANLSSKLLAIDCQSSSSKWQSQ